MDLKKDVTILGAKLLNFTNDGQEVKGCQVFYTEVEEVRSEHSVGCLPAKAWLPLESYSYFTTLNYPIRGFCEFDIDFTKGKLKPKRFFVKDK